MFWPFGIGCHVTGDLWGGNENDGSQVPQPKKAKEQSSNPKETLGSSMGVILMIGSQLF